MASRLPLGHVLHEERPKALATFAPEGKDLTLAQSIEYVVKTHIDFYRSSLVTMMDVIRNPGTDLARTVTLAQTLNALFIFTIKKLKEINAKIEAGLAEALFDYLRVCFYTPRHLSKPELPIVKMTPPTKNHWIGIYELLQDHSFKLIGEEIVSVKKCLRLFLDIATNIKDPEESKRLDALSIRRGDLRSILRQKSVHTFIIDGKSFERAALQEELNNINLILDEQKQPLGINPDSFIHAYLPAALQDTLQFINRFEKHLKIKTQFRIEKGELIAADPDYKTSPHLTEEEKNFLLDLRQLKLHDPDFIKRLFLRLSETELKALHESDQEIKFDFSALQHQHPKLMAALFPNGNPNNDTLVILKLGFYLLLEKNNLMGQYQAFKAECVRRGTGPRCKGSI